MRTAHTWPSALLLIGLLTVLPTSTAANYLPGVQPGDWAKYGQVSATWQSDIPGVNPPDPIFIFLITQSILITVTDVSGTNVTISGTANYTNGTSETSIWSGDIKTGAGGLSFWVLSAGLNPGDPIYDAAGAPTINYTTTQVFAGVLREAAVLDLNITLGTAQITALALWDRATGILLQIDYTVFYDYFGQTASGTSMARLTETNLWYAGTPHFTISAYPTSLAVNLPVNEPNVTVTSTLTLTSLGNFSGPVSITALTTPSILNYPTIQVNPQTITLGLNSIVNSTLSVLVRLDTAPGVYLVNITATDGTQGHTIFVPVTVNPIISGDFSLTTSPYPLYVRAGLFNSTVIFVTSVGGFSGTVRLASWLTDFNATASIFVTLDPYNVTLAPSSISISTLTVSVGPNATGTFTVMVNGTSGSLQHETSVAVVIVPGGPSNLPPVAIISAPSQASVGSPVSFSGAGSFDPDGFITSYYWTFGDNATGSGAFVSHAYYTPGYYTVTLTVTDNMGAAGTASTVVQVTQQVTHDVAIITLQPALPLVVQGQPLGILVALQDQGLQDEFVDLTVYANGHILASRSNIFLDRNDPFGGLVFLTGDTSGLTPGNYTVSATVFLATDEDPSDNSLIDGVVTVLPPPIITVTPDSGTLRTAVTVHGAGFPQPPYSYGPIPVLVSFDDQFIGYALQKGGSFNFTFSIPHAEPGLHQVKAFDAYSGVQAATGFTVLESPGPQNAPQLSLSLDVGTIYFPGETAVIYLQASLNGTPTAPSGPVTATLYKPDGSTLQLNLAPLGNGVYKAQYAVPRTSSLGTYAVVATASHGLASAADMATFEVKPTWLSSNGPRVATASLATLGIIAAVGISWQRGFFRRKPSKLDSETILRTQQQTSSGGSGDGSTT